MFVLCNLAHGTTSVIADCDWSNPGASDAWPLLRQICRHRVARLVLPPALCERIAATGVQLPQLEEIFTGGGPVFPGLLRRLAQVAPNAAITTVYGGSEAEPIAHVAAQDLSPEDFAQMHAGGGLLAGAPVAGIDLRIEDDEIWVSGAHVIKSYRNPADDRDTKRVRDGKIWHRTGDAGRLDARGRLWLLGRHEARSGGLFPFCVEAAARNLPGVRNAALVHVGTTPTLTLECDGRSAPPLAAELTRRWGDRLRVVLVPRIPLDRRHRSKTDYGELRKLLLRRGYS
jgi:acyl-CoA synthetase (AMP-forming)/AMP-acid ligase II